MSNASAPCARAMGGPARPPKRDASAAAILAVATSPPAGPESNTSRPRTVLCSARVPSDRITRSRLPGSAAASSSR